MDTIQLVQQAKRGNKEALVKLVMHKKSEYYKLAFVYMGNKEDSLDALADMIVILYEKINQLKDAEAFYSWSKTILVNCCRKLLRRNKKIILVGKFKEKGYEENYTNREQRIDIKQQLTKLNKYQQEAIKLRYFLDLDYKTISEITEVPEGTVKSRVSNGISKLKMLLGGEY